MFELDHISAEGVAHLFDADAGCRTTRAPGEDLSDLPDDLQAAISEHWPQGAVEAYAAAYARPAPTPREALDAIYDEKRRADFQWDFGSTSAIDDLGNTEPAGVRALQIRDDGDQSNWNSAATAALLAFVGGTPARLLPIKSVDNFWIQTPASQVLQVLPAMMGRQVALLARYGALKAELLAAEDPATIDVAFGWPPA